MEKITIDFLKNLKRNEKKKRKISQNCKSPIERQRFIITTKNVTEGKKKAQKLN